MVNRDATLIIPLQEAHLPLWILIFRFARLVVLFFVQDINRIKFKLLAAVRADNFLFIPDFFLASQ